MLKPKIYRKLLICCLLSILSLSATARANTTNPAFASTLTPELRAVMSANVNIDPISPHLVFHDPEQAHAWLSDMSHRLARFVPDKKLRRYYLTIIDYEAVRAKLDPQLVLSIITVESMFKPYAVSKAGAVGLMQIMPQWKQTLGHPNQDLFDVRTNIRYGCTILRYYMQSEHGDLIKALERYNGSHGHTWYPQAIYQTYTTYWHPYPVMEMRNGKLVAVNYIN